MFALAVKSGIPIISAQTTDTVNVQAVIQELAGETVSQAPDKMSGLSMHKPCRVFWTTKAIACDEALYSDLIAKNKCLIVINHPDPGPLAFSVGVIPTPKKMIRELLEQVLPGNEVEGMLSCFSGLTIKDLGEVARLTMVRDGSLTSQGVLHTRALLASKTQGLQQIDTSMGIYVPYAPLEAWVALNKPFFSHPPDPRLIPRGLLLQGPPGTGKTEAAKFIANQWKIPAYRLDLTSALGRYVGESEGNVLRVLNTLDEEEPNLVLIDECEKLFNGGSDQGVTSRILSQLLWWMQAHRSRVFTVMTTNDSTAIPQELYRSGRIDKAFTIEKLEYYSAAELSVQIVSSFKPKITKEDGDVINEALDDLLSEQEDTKVSHAQITQLMYDLIKQHKWF
jgi:hypothetical protein